MNQSAYRTVAAVVVAVLLAAAPLAVAATASAAAGVPAGVTAGARPARVVPRAGVFAGLGFDACTTPSEADMSAWSASPFRAVAVYVGGVNRACAQPALTSAWVEAELAAGWAIIPTYVGLQAPGNSCGCAAIVPADAAAEGGAAATDAVEQLQAIGISAGNPVYYDMEGYTRGGTTTTAVLDFLAAWTAGLHAAGYVSGVYSSSGSGVLDLVSRYGSGYEEPDDLWIADWNGEKTTSDPAVPAADWADHQRVHQFDGGEDDTYGGVTIDVDGDEVDGAAVVGGLPKAPTGVVALAGNRSATVTWKAPAGGAAPVAYEVTSSPGKHLTVVAAPATSAVVALLTDGTAYTFTVVALSASGAGPPSAASAAVTATHSTVVPTQPRQVRASASGTTATVTWTAPAATGGDPISSYSISASPGGETVTVSGSTLRATIGGLASGTAYTFVVTAVTARGPGEPSARSGSVTA